MTRAESGWQLCSCFRKLGEVSREMVDERKLRCGRADIAEKRTDVDSHRRITGGCSGSLQNGMKQTISTHDVTVIRYYTTTRRPVSDRSEVDHRG